jgi:hypothetical protein
MNTQWLKLFLVRGILGLSVALAALMPVKAQSDLQVQVTVPFDFIVGDARFPAGDYSLRPHTTAQGVLMITNSDERRTRLFEAHFAERPALQDHAMLVFDRYEDHTSSVKSGRQEWRAMNCLNHEPNAQSRRTWLRLIHNA